MGSVKNRRAGGSGPVCENRACPRGRAGAAGAERRDQLVLGAGKLMRASSKPENGMISVFKRSL